MSRACMIRRVSQLLRHRHGEDAWCPTSGPGMWWRNYVPEQLPPPPSVVTAFSRMSKSCSRFGRRAERTRYGLVYTGLAPSTTSMCALTPFSNHCYLLTSPFSFPWCDVHTDPEPGRNLIHSQSSLMVSSQSLPNSTCLLPGTTYSQILKYCLSCTVHAP